MFTPSYLMPVHSLAPAADAAGRTGAWVKMTNITTAYAIFYLGQGNAATIACSVQQATSVGGAGAKAISSTRVFTNLTATGFSAFTRQTDAATFTTDAALLNKFVILQVDPRDLDINNSFTYVAAVTGASNAANITAAYFMVWNEDSPGQANVMV